LILIADENIYAEFIAKLRNHGFEVLSIRESHPGSSDIDIIEMARYNHGILLTEDKDFGEWVFAHGIKDIDVILLRYDKIERDVTFGSVRNTLEHWIEGPASRFVTITGKKIRSRTL
jgi:predicted nuclease of predicted toxin-antitoxin system